MTVYLHFQDNSEPWAELNFASQNEPKSRRVFLEISEFWPVVELARGRSKRRRLVSVSGKVRGFSSQNPVSEGAKLHLTPQRQEAMGAFTATSGELPNNPLAEASGAQWYALYTAPRHEKQVADRINRQGISCFLPLYRSMRRWKDRRKELSLVLFPGYVFVRMALQNRFRVLQLPGAVRLVSFNGQPAPLPEDEIENLRSRLVGSNNIEPHPYLTAGRHVRVRSGPLQGLEGIILRTKDRCRIVLSIHLIMRSLAVEVDDGDLEFIA